MKHLFGFTRVSSSVKNCILPSDSEANRDGADAVVAKTEFIHTPTIEINLNSQIHLVFTSELIENDSLNRKITQAINKSVKITEYQTMNCLSFCVKTYIM